ncbi:hypothetical protein [Nocardia brasiliensis]|uniref:hypothetical protein n=1 Tax=Nocardia brasiliensis TaxID=37326 RepID=UPI0024575CF3|nr:hypothetical protein [Nocardia brasiliensis]
MDKVGLCAGTDIGVPITGRLDDRRWIPFIGHNRGTYGLLELGALLQASCYITVAYLSGLRDSELKHLRRGAVPAQPAADEDREPISWSMASALAG